MRCGGSERQVALLAKHLPRDRFDVHLYLTHREGELLAELPADVIVHSPIAAPPGWSPAIFDCIPGTILRRQAAEFAEVVRRERIDVVYDRVFHNTMIAGHPAIKKLAVRRVSTIVSPPHVALPMVEKRFVRAKRRLLVNAYRRSDRIIAVSQAVADSAADYYGLSRERIIVIRNPVDVAWVRGTAGWTEPPVRKSDPDPLRIVCVGRMTPEKGQSDLITAMSTLRGCWRDTLPRVSLRLIGDGNDRLRLEQQWAAVGGDSREDGHSIEFAGEITPALPEMARADALVLPSLFEGMPNVLLEAFALQVPVIATSSGGTRELLLHAEHPTCFWAEPDDPASLAIALRDLAADPKKRTAHVIAATQLIQSRHAVEIAIEKISEQLLG